MTVCRTPSCQRAPVRDSVWCDTCIRAILSRAMQGHPKRSDDLRIVRDGIIGALVLFAVVVGAAVWL